MDIPKKYFHDKIVLLLISVNAFLTLLTTAFILWRFDVNRTEGYFVQYRSNLGLNAYKVGGFDTFIAFIIFAVFVLVFHIFISMRIFPVRRHLAVGILGFGTLLLVLTIVVSNALLVLAH
jgi:hypothetical protein